jgi:hypothetical protein
MPVYANRLNQLTSTIGIVGANANATVIGTFGAGFQPPVPFTGVAPEVTLGAYRVFGCDGGTTDDIMVCFHLFLFITSFIKFK